MEEAREYYLLYDFSTCQTNTFYKCPNKQHHCRMIDFQYLEAFVHERYYYPNEDTSKKKFKHCKWCRNCARKAKTETLDVNGDIISSMDHQYRYDLYGNRVKFIKCPYKAHHLRMKEYNIEEYVEQKYYHTDEDLSKRLRAYCKWCTDHSNRERPPVIETENQRITKSIIDSVYLICTEGTRECNFATHHCRMKDFGIRRDVPIRFFHRNDDLTDEVVHTNCRWCREFKHGLQPMVVNGQISAREQNRPHTDELFLSCASRDHKCYSEMPRHSTPREYFMKDANDPHSYLLWTCKDCRNYDKIRLELIRIKKSLCLPEDHSLCYRCRHGFPNDYFGLRIDGKQYSLCPECREVERLYHLDYYFRSKEEQRKHKFFNMLKLESCCSHCDVIFIKGDIVQCLVKIYDDFKVIDNIKYVNVDDVYVGVKDFITANRENIEYSVIHYDHLTEEEQRESGILDTREYVDKKINVSETRLRHIEFEIGKCKMLCKRCHVLETMRRANQRVTNNPLTLNKLSYLNDIKSKGCQSCHRVYTPLRFIEMDHINPDEKISTIGSLVVNTCCTFDQFVAECDKCRPLCGFCHQCWSNYQINTGITQKRNHWK